MKLRESSLIRRALAAFVIAVCASAFAAARAQNHVPVIDKIEPPSWWAGHTINPVRLLVRGKSLNHVRVSVEDNAPFEVGETKAKPSGTYMLVDLYISPTARPGDYRLRFSTSTGFAFHNFRINARLDPSKNFQGVTSDDVIYLVMPDRFADGDPSNNAPRDAPAEANDRRNPRAWHGGDLRGVINRLPYLKELGVTALWLNPWYDNWNGVNRCAEPWCPNTYYHGYHAVDYYAVEDRFGDLGTLRELVDKAHAVGIKVIQDQVANHVGSQHHWAKDLPLDNWFHGTMQNHLRNPFRGDLLNSPHTSEAARRPTLDGWFSDDLPDVNQEEPEVARYEIQNALWWVGVTGIDGIRQDTVQYLPRFFIRDLNAALDRQYPKMWMVGEAWNTEPLHTSFFIGGRAGWDGIDTRMDSVFDFPVWEVSWRVFTGKSPVGALREILRADAVYHDASRLTTMANNHDVKRFMSLEGATLEGAMMHVAFTLAIRGTPQLYYGEEIAMRGGDDPDNRRDFPGGFAGDPRDAFTKEGRTAEEQRMFEWTRDWIRLRRERPSIRRGALIDLHWDDDSYAFARRDDKETTVIVFNRAAAPKEISLQGDMLEARDGARLEPLLAAKERAHFAAGAAKLVVPARTAAAYKLVLRTED